jgi:hypothetical protein
MIQTTIDKARLKLDEVLMHQHLGIVKYTAECQRLEEMHGMPCSLYVSDAGEIKEVTLALLEQACQ